MGKGKSFDLAAMMETVSKLDTTASAPQVRMIPLEDILTNRDNFYRVSKEDLQPLADSIALDGLQQYPVVMPSDKEPGKYLLISGHRRTAAIRMLVEEDGREDLRLVPCTVREYASRNMAELQMILANSTARVLAPAEVSRQAQRLEELFYRLKEEEGFEFPGRMRDRVAVACQVSAPKIARLKVIREKLKAPEFLLLFEKNKLPEQTAYALARLPEEFQKRLAGITADISGIAAEQVLKQYSEGWRWEPDQKCPDGKACKRGDAFLRRDLEHPHNMCGGKTCCLVCRRAKEEYAPCDRMCSKARALQKEKQDEKKARAEEEKQARIAQYKEETQLHAQRVLRAIEMAGLTDEEIIPWGYSGRFTVEEIRALAAGEFPEGKCWYHAELSAESLTRPDQTAETLSCSTDYLLGMTDELTPPASGMAGNPEFLPSELGDALRAGVWLPGFPDRSRQVVAQFISREMDPWVTLCWYDDESLAYSIPERGSRIEEKCAGWWPVPDPEKNPEALKERCEEEGGPRP